MYENSANKHFPIFPRAIKSYIIANQQLNDLRDLKSLAPGARGIEMIPIMGSNGSENVNPFNFSIKRS